MHALCAQPGVTPLSPAAQSIHPLTILRPPPGNTCLLTRRRMQRGLRTTLYRATRSHISRTSGHWAGSGHGCARRERQNGIDVTHNAARSFFSGGGCGDLLVLQRPLRPGRHVSPYQTGVWAGVIGSQLFSLRKLAVAGTLAPSVECVRPCMQDFRLCDDIRP